MRRHFGQVSRLVIAPSRTPSDWAFWRAFESIGVRFVSVRSILNYFQNLSELRHEPKRAQSAFSIRAAAPWEQGKFVYRQDPHLSETEREPHTI
jgi:hypothetical protein